MPSAKHSPGAFEVAIMAQNRFGWHPGCTKLVPNTFSFNLMMKFYFLRLAVVHLPASLGTLCFTASYVCIVATYI